MSLVRVFLIHGMGRTSGSMLLLSKRLAREGHAPSRHGYRVSLPSLEALTDRFIDHVRANVQRNEPYAVVGHSLGNVITRMASPRLPDGFCRFAMLAPPNQSPALARRGMRRSATYRLLTGDAGRKLSDRDFMATLPRPDVPTIILAGHASRPWLPHRGAPSDGIVAVDETRLDDVPHRTYPVSHTFIMNDAAVTDTLIHFIDHGTLD
jgi:hypothetical protein